jgi:UDP-N-acetylglucosamine 4,6-dehydratase/5-epimerase
MKNKVVLITGGTGSFGNEMTSHLLKIGAKKIVIFSRDEFKQAEMKKKFHNNKKMRFFIGDVRDQNRLDMAMIGIDIVIHAAALKRVEVAEYNPFEAVKTNIYGAQNIIESALRNEVDKVIALSTDKAVNPINLYGATKLASDKLFISANNLVGKKRTRFSVVRYGNVLASRGSVVPIFQKYFEQGKGYFPITSKLATRFWITLNSAVKFVINCSTDMSGGEIFIPKMPSVLISDLAKAISEKYRLKEIGLGHGEKLHESIFSISDCENTYENKDMFLIEPDIKFFKKKKYKYFKNLKKIKKKFDYTSKKNIFLNIKEIKNHLKEF